VRLPTVLDALSGSHEDSGEFGQTVEPGIYFSPHLLAPHRDSKFINHETLRRYESVGGVRIEDVVTITANGAENLTTVGKEVDWLEAVSSGSM